MAERAHTITSNSRLNLLKWMAFKVLCIVVVYRWMWVCCWRARVYGFGHVYVCLINDYTISLSLRHYVRYAYAISHSHTTRLDSTAAYMNIWNDMSAYKWPNYFSFIYIFQCWSVHVVCCCCFVYLLQNAYYYYLSMESMILCFHFSTKGKSGYSSR